MHPAILDAAGYTLLLSGLITLVMLLREGYKHKKRSPFYILSTSDVFSSIVIAVALLASHIEAGVKFSYNWQNNTNDTEVDRTWTIKDDSKYKLLFPRARDLSREAARELDSNVTLTCDVKNVFMQYGMLLAPLTNALVSLLTFAVQCNLNAACIKRKCANVMRSSAADIRFGANHVEDTCRRRATSEDQQELASQRSNVSAKNANIVRRIMKMFQFQTLRKSDKKPAGFLVTSHWLMPFLVTAILCFAEYDDMNTVRRVEDTECIFESNFPVNFHVFLDNDNLKIANSGMHTTPWKNYYFVDEASNKSNISSVEVNRIVFKVQSIVNNVLSYIHNSTLNTKATSLLDASRLQNRTDYVATNNINRIENVTDVDGAEETQATNDTITEQIASVYNLSSQADNRTYLNEDPEMLLFYNLLKNASEESDVTLGSSSNVMQTDQNKNGSYEEDMQTYLAEEDATQKTVNIPITQDTTFVSDDQIYADILKRIHAANAYTVLKNHRNRSVDQFYGKKQPKRNNLKDYIARIKTDSIADLLLRKYDHLERDVNAETGGSPHMINECLVSNDFLKLHLLVLSFAVYFLPILLCCILQVQAEHTCENTLAILKAKFNLMSILLNSNDDDSVVIVNEGAHTEWLSTSSRSIGRQNSTDGFNKPLEIRDSHGSTTDVGTTTKNHESCVEAQNRDMLLEVNCTTRICKVVKVSLILCVLLWSPIFLGTLLKVFSCIHAPQWLTDTTFLSAISFGIIRNILNIYIIKIHELCSNDNTKENRIYPIE